ncbi:hypothetical_protein [Leishmania braziliensis MHOM/BR/75/M2904]|uniref:Hypothetical_protein n=1 Tax=Leishmania braziliensis MHOM/BR/75/M2904 TaxID=420245 RepID=A0A3P3ZFH0_LEIBR|nr:hypothetical_protein [Leishmania braziliensis MHOM/BR/75/M2904]
MQGVLLGHIHGLVLYLDDVGDVSVSHKLPPHQPRSIHGDVASRHWLPHGFLQSGGASAKVTLYPTGPTAQHGPSTPAAIEAAVSASSFPRDASAFSLHQGSSGTTVLDDLKRAPPVVLSNKSLYAMMDEVVVRALSRPDAAGSPSSEGDTAHAFFSRLCRVMEDTLALWLRFYSDVMPYFYRDLVPSAEMVVGVLLCAPEGRQHTGFLAARLLLCFRMWGRSPSFSGPPPARIVCLLLSVAPNSAKCDFRGARGQVCTRVW